MYFFIMLNVVVISILCHEGNEYEKRFKKVLTKEPSYANVARN